jgi:hypothetical protein
MTEDDYKAVGTTAKPYDVKAWVSSLSTAYWVADGSPKYTFINADITTIGKLPEKEDTPDAWTITWISKEACTDDASKNFEIVLTGTCKANAKGVISNAKLDAKNKCKATVEYTGANACGKEIPLVKSLKKLTPIFGGLLIVFGGLMVFFGSKFLFHVFGVIVGFVAAAFFFLLSYALILPVEAETKMLVGVITVCVILGGATAFISFKFTKSFIVPILGAVGGVVVFLMLVKLAKLRSGTWNIVFGIIGAVCGLFLAYRFKRIIKAAGTALIGSFLFVRGIGCYAPGYPNEMDINAKELYRNPNANMQLIAYLAGFILLGLVGSIFQMRYEAEEDK